MRVNPAHILSALAFLALLSACTQIPDYQQLTGYAQGGTYRIVYRCPEGSEHKGQCGPEALKRGIDSILCVVDTALSGYNPHSLVSRINRGWCVDADSSAEYRLLVEISAYCDSLCEATGGALDCRAGALYDIWGFGFKDGRMPSEDEVREAMSDRSHLNFNAVAQGYSADLVAGYLSSAGITDYLVDIGGEFSCRGKNPSGSNWTIGIDAPLDWNDRPGVAIAASFILPDTAPHGVVTSGNYRKFYIIDGVKYSHTIDPRSGRPVQHKLLSATVLAPTSALADAMATYCMVLGPEDAAAFIENRPDLEACLISSDGIWASSGFHLNKQ